MAAHLAFLPAGSLRAIVETRASRTVYQRCSTAQPRLTGRAVSVLVQAKRKGNGKGSAGDLDPESADSVDSSADTPADSPMPAQLTVPEPEDMTPSDAEVVPLQPQLMLPESDTRFEGIKAFVAGASGRTGREIVKRLVTEGVPVRAFVRNAIKSVEVLPGLDKNVELVEGDVYDFQSVMRGMDGCDVVLCATGASGLGNPLDPFKVDYEGTLNLIAAAKRAGVRRFVLVSSIGVDPLLSPFNLFGGLAFWKKQAELALQRSGIDYTIVRPGGLRSEVPEGQSAGGVVMASGGDYGLLPGQRFPTGSILRSMVADCCVEALVVPAANNKVVEIVTESDAPNRPFTELFEGVR